MLGIILVPKFVDKIHEYQSTPEKELIPRTVTWK